MFVFAFIMLNIDIFDNVPVIKLIFPLLINEALQINFFYSKQF